MLTSAGKTAALDLCIHLVRRDYGAAAANGLVRRMVVPAHRPGGQAQFIAPPRRRAPDGLAITLDWARADSTSPSPSTTSPARPPQPPPARPPDADGARRPARSTGSTVNGSHWRRSCSRRSDASVDADRGRCGIGTATTLRRHFHRPLGVTPTAYRTTFRLTDDPQLRP